MADGREAEAGWSLQTRAVVTGRPVGVGEPLNEPVVLASNFRDGPEYARTHGTSTWRALEHAIGDLEGGRCTSFASGMAAANALIFAVRPRRVLISRTSYLGVRALLTELQMRGSLEVDIVDTVESGAVGEFETRIERAAPETLVWLESPANPTLEELDLARLCAVGRARHVATVVDSTFATPIAHQPLTFGASAVLHSGTKFIGGHSDLMIGLAVTADDALAEALVTSRTLQGAVPGALESFLALRGLRTLPLRYRAMTATAAVLAERLSGHPGVAWVKNVGPMVSFIVAGGSVVADRVCADLRLIVPATSLGGVETTIERRQKYPGDAHVDPGLLRMSVGLEDPDDLWGDLDEALRRGES